MKFQFKKQATEIITDMREYITEKDLPITVELFTHSIVISVSKWGTSTFTFEMTYLINERILTLTHKRIHWLHKSYKEQFKEELVKAMESIGGKKL